jgi:3-oxoacyl-[acyl-carrier protein] reductase
MKLKNQVAIVTGAAGGIGGASAVKLAEQGANVVLVDLLPCVETEKKIQELGTDVHVLQKTGDIRDVSFVKEVVKDAANTFNEIHILVNNAGTCARIDLEEMTEEMWDRDLDTNLKATYFFMQAVIYPYMKKQQYGRIVNISSISGMNGGHTSSFSPDSKKGRSGPAYAASKGGVIALTKWVAKEVGELGICCNSVAPGATETGITKGLNYSLDNQVIKRIGEPDDIAEAVVYFASPGAGYTTGQVLKVCGGGSIG